MIKVVIWKAKPFSLKKRNYASNSAKYLTEYLSNEIDSLGMWWSPL